jgi:hypothetical protein
LPELDNRGDFLLKLDPESLTEDFLNGSPFMEEEKDFLMLWIKDQKDKLKDKKGWKEIIQRVKYRE